MKKSKFVDRKRGIAMPATTSSYDFIKSRIASTKNSYPSLRNKSDDYVFTALCIKSKFYKNPALVLTDSDISDFIVDGQYDGGVDALLSDPNTDGADLVLCQSKFYQSITSEDIQNALLKMALFYKDMKRGYYEQVNATVQQRFLSLDAEVGEESKIHFVFFTSAPKSGIRSDRLERKFMEQFPGAENIVISILFAPEIEEEIKESESRRPSVESGKIHIDDADNYLLYGDDAAIVNVSACSIKQLYAQHSTNLLARNLRYHVAGRDIDNAIKETISNDPDSFWMKNNGITIICEDFDIDGKDVKLRNFSIVNGGQTTYQIYKSASVNTDNDFYLPCKIIKVIGETEDAKNEFSLSIAKATNSQKAIKPVDLKANSPEQIRFAREMRQAGIYYQTKRGETVPPQFREAYLNTDLVEIGKLCLAGIFQLPGKSRNKPSSLYEPKYYAPVFDGDQAQIAALSKELLYIDFYFRKTYQKIFDSENASLNDSGIRISFAHNARTICVAFVALSARIRQNNLSDQSLSPMFTRTITDSVTDSLYDVFKDLGNLRHFVDPQVFSNKDKYDELLKRLFDIIINAGVFTYQMEIRYDNTITPSNYLKRDVNYYTIISTQYNRIKDDFMRVYDELGI